MDAATLWNTPVSRPPSLQDFADDAGQLGNPLLHFSKTKGAVHLGCTEFSVRPPENADFGG